MGMLWFEMGEGSFVVMVRRLALITDPRLAGVTPPHVSRYVILIPRPSTPNRPSKARTWLAIHSDTLHYDSLPQRCLQLA